LQTTKEYLKTGKIEKETVIFPLSLSWAESQFPLSLIRHAVQQVAGHQGPVHPYLFIVFLQTEEQLGVLPSIVDPRPGDARRRRVPSRG
jgi:hypothetical protein